MHLNRPTALVLSVSLGLFLGTNPSQASTRFNLYEPVDDIATHVNTFTNSTDAYQSLLSLESSLENQGTSGKAAIQPWSGSYWPLYLGSVSYAYNTRGGRSSSFGRNLDNFEYRRDRILSRVSRMRSEELEDLSPTEKYDLFLGDTHFTLTNAVWASLQETDDNRKGRIKDWEGLCHGWSPASAYAKRPEHVITIPSLDHKFMIPFYPHDLKALETLLWSNSLIQDQTVVEGMRCKTDSPRRDRYSGKTTTTRCKGVNPGVFHLALLGVMGKKHMSFIINRNNNDEVWNQPVASYDFYYFDVRDGRKASLQRAAIPIKNFDDPFAKFRPKNAVFLVGVDMTLKYLDESDPSHEIIDSPAKDKIEKLHMRYDLELDAAYNVLGGEWVDDDSDDHGAYSRSIPQYPGFIWKFHSDTPYASSVADMQTPDPSSADFTSEKLVPLSKLASQFRYQRYALDEDGDTDKIVLGEDGKPIPTQKELRPQPLAKVVNYLVDLSTDPATAPKPTPTPNDDEDDFRHGHRHNDENRSHGSHENDRSRYGNGDSDYHDHSHGGYHSDHDEYRRRGW